MTDRDSLQLEKALESLQKKGWIGIAIQLIFIGMAYANIQNGIKNNQRDIIRLEGSQAVLIQELKESSTKLERAIRLDRWTRKDHDSYAVLVDSRFLSIERRISKLEK